MPPTSRIARWSPLMGLLSLAASLIPALASAQSVTNVAVLGSQFRGLTQVGVPFQFRLTAARAGVGEGVNAYAEVTLPPQLQFLALSYDSGTADCTTPTAGSSGVIRCLLPSTGSFVSVQLNLQLKIDDNATVGSILTTRAVAGSDVPDSNPNDNTASFLTLVQSGNEVSDLRVRIEADPDPVAPGALITHRIILENLGPDTASWPGVNFPQPFADFELIPGITRLVPATTELHLDFPDGWDCLATAPPPPIFPSGPAGFSCRAITMPPGLSVFTWTGNVRRDVIGPIRISATAYTASIDPVADNNTTGLTQVRIGFPEVTPIPLTTRWSLALLALLVAAAAWFGTTRGR